MASLQKSVPPQSDNQQHPQLVYTPNFLDDPENVDACISRANKEEGDLMDSVDLARITTSWIHRVLHHVGTMQNRQCNKKYKRFQPKFS